MTTTPRPQKPPPIPYKNCLIRVSAHPRSHPRRWEYRFSIDATNRQMWADWFCTRDFPSPEAALNAAMESIDWRNAHEK